MKETQKSKTRKLKTPKEMHQSAVIIAKDQNPAVGMQDLLGDKLRAYYDKVASEPVPDRFELLLKQLELKTSPKKPR